MKREPGERAIGATSLEPRLWRRFWPYLRPRRATLAVVLALVPVNTGAQLLPPLLLMRAIDDAIVPGDLPLLARISALYFAAYFARAILELTQAVLMQLCAQQATDGLRIAAHRHVLQLRCGFFDRTPAGQITVVLTNDVNSITDALSNNVVSTLGHVLTLAGIAATMLALDAPLALILFALVGALALLARPLPRRVRRQLFAVRERFGRVAARQHEILSGVRTIQSFGLEARARADFEQATGEHLGAQLRAVGHDAALVAVVELMGSVVLAILIWSGGSGVLGAGVSVGLLAAFIHYAQKSFEPIRELSGKYGAIQEATAAADRVFALLDARDLEVDRLPADARAPGAAAADGLVTFERACFGYDPGAPILNGASFTLRRGERVAIVGATGAGKSTIVRLLTRLYELDAGAILLDGQDIRALPLAELRRRVAVVSQEAFLLRGTVRSNVTLGDPAIAEAHVARVLDRVGLSDLLSLDRAVDERGANLSAGERQLVLLLRALVRDPELLVLDEATAHVDARSDALLREATAELMRDRSMLVIAHRLTSVEGADRILVLEDGRFTEEGTHAELLAAGGLYASLAAQQTARTATSLGSPRGSDPGNLRISQ